MNIWYNNSIINIGNSIEICKYDFDRRTNKVVLK